MYLNYYLWRDEMKKWTLLLLSLATTNPVLAHYKAFSGFYGGLNLGLVESIVHDDTNTTLTWPNAFNISITSASKVTNTALRGGVTLGYSTFVTAGWVLGLEGRYNFQNLAIRNNEYIHEVNSMLEIEKHLSVKMDQDFALVGKLGFASCCKFLMYGLLGIDWAKVNLNIDSLYRQNLGNLISGTLQNASSQYESGLMLGLGVEYYLTKCATIGLEYNYVDYGSLKFRNPMSGWLMVDGVPQVGSFITDNNALNLQTNRFFLKLNYYFA